jgi:tetratricopeptide (TPR) repeat protein
MGLLRSAGRGATAFVSVGTAYQVLLIYFETRLPLPLFISVFVNIWLLWELVVTHTDDSDESDEDDRSADEVFSDAVLVWTEELHEQGRHMGVISLRKRFSHVLHILGFHEVRYEVGELALQSANILRERDDRVEILIDDMGWTLHMCGKTEEAIDNIQKGVNIARQTTGEKSGRLILAEAKGLRHLSFLYTLKGRSEAESYIEKAKDVLDTHPEPESGEVQRDRMQLLHTRAEIRCMNYGILSNGKIRNNPEAEAEIESSIDDLTEVIETFEALGDLERAAKSMRLKVRMLNAIDRELDAKEVEARLDDFLKKSQLFSYDRISPVSDG